MPTLTADEFRAKYPEFTDRPDAELTATLAVANSIGAVNSEAFCLLTAHLLILNAERQPDPDGGSGEVVSETIGPKSIDYKTQADSGGDVFFTRTAYGRLFLTIERRHPSRVMSVRVHG